MGLLMVFTTMESSLRFADEANHKRLAAMQAAQQARAQAEWLISAANVAKGEARAHQAQARTQKQLIEGLVAEVKGVSCALPWVWLAASLSKLIDRYVCESSAPKPDRRVEGTAASCQRQGCSL